MQKIQRNNILLVPHAILLWLFVFVTALISMPQSASSEAGIRSSSSFKAPPRCKNTRSIATALNAVQACQQRFSPTHEFSIVLLEKRFRTNAKSDSAARSAVKRTVTKYIADLRKVNSQAPGQTLKLFETSDYSPSEGLPKGAEFCVFASGVVSDRRVPSFPGEEFRIWIDTHVCARFDAANKTIQLVELRASERFRVATDGARAHRRFGSLMPAVAASKAMQTLRLY